MMDNDTKLVHLLRTQYDELLNERDALRNVLKTLTDAMFLSMGGHYLSMGTSDELTVQAYHMALDLLAEDSD